MSALAGQFRALKSAGRKFATLTAYDYSLGRILDGLGLDFILVGDSVGMIQLGHPDTTQVTLEEMAHHVKAVAAGVTKTLLVADLRAALTQPPDKPGPPQNTCPAWVREPSKLKVAPR